VNVRVRVSDPDPAPRLAHPREENEREKESLNCTGNYSSAFTLKRPTVGDGMHLP